MVTACNITGPSSVKRVLLTGSHAVDSCPGQSVIHLNYGVRFAAVTNSHIRRQSFVISLSPHPHPFSLLTLINRLSACLSFM